MPCGHELGAAHFSYVVRVRTNPCRRVCTYDLLDARAQTLCSSRPVRNLVCTMQRMYRLCARARLLVGVVVEEVLALALAFALAVCRMDVVAGCPTAAVALPVPRARFVGDLCTRARERNQPIALLVCDSILKDPADPPHRRL